MNEEYIYIYIYISREREREREREAHIYIYIEREREREGHTCNYFKFLENPELNDSRIGNAKPRPKPTFVFCAFFVLGPPLLLKGTFLAMSSGFFPNI